MKRVIKDWLEDLQLELFTLVVKLWLPIIDNPDDVFVETQVTYDAKSQTSTVIRRLVRDVALQRALRTDVYVGSFFGVLFESELGISLNQYRVLEDLMSDQGRTQESPAVIEKVAVLTD
ncbi:MAG TPA: hypothetical protein VLE72_00620 [Candidatus Saccharimonadales bacterium]|nr:hypothetical protein [Candidatus Saccharimonadales bacterium]